MKAKIIAWLGEKGGGGKTTNIINIGCLLKKQGHTVLIVDADPNKSASSWSVQAGENAPAVVMMQENIKTDVIKLKAVFDYILIDCEGGLVKATLDSIKIADAVIVPYQPSPLDVWGNDSLLELIEARQELTDGKPVARLLLNTYDKRNKISKITQNALEEYSIPLLKEQTSRLTDYVLTLVDGGSVIDFNEDHQGHFEIRKLTKAIMALIHE